MHANWPTNFGNRLGFMGWRTKATLGAIKAISPAFEAFYSSLDADQRTRLGLAVGDGATGAASSG